MCIVTLSYNENSKAAVEKLAALLNTGLFVEVGATHQKLDIDYADPSLYENCVPLPDQKDFYTPEDLRALLISDINQICLYH